MITKSLFRKTILQYRQLLDEGVYAERNERLFQRLQELVDSKRPKKIHTFLAMKKNREPDISFFLNWFWERDIGMMVSKTDFQSKKMHHYNLTPATKLKENRMGIPEPEDAAAVSIEQADLILVPLLVSDRKGHRIGYGGGYYDRLLRETKALKVGLCLSPPVDKILQREDWDIPIDYLITPFKTYNYG
ncbi:MAG: 5-formyltetrahydrofolate cyclo-ligase [Ekhidna sp.]|uniref:5-formyltetrahydrofolate cyclo-ligase n=1 Tax=Ekhidna sp. TaxID=2608089 RepID=UPI0032ECE414